MVSCKVNFSGNPELTSFLVDEIARATLVEPERTRNVVTMNSWVEFYYDLDDQFEGSSWSIRPRPILQKANSQ